MRRYDLHLSLLPWLASLALTPACVLDPLGVGGDEMDSTGGAGATSGQATAADESAGVVDEHADEIAVVWGDMTPSRVTVAPNGDGVALLGGFDAGAVSRFNLAGELWKYTFPSGAHLAIEVLESGTIVVGGAAHYGADGGPADVKLWGIDDNGALVWDRTIGTAKGAIVSVEEGGGLLWTVAHLDDNLPDRTTELRRHAPDGATELTVAMDGEIYASTVRPDGRVYALYNFDPVDDENEGQFDVMLIDTDGTTEWSREIEWSPEFPFSPSFRNTVMFFDEAIGLIIASTEVSNLDVVLLDAEGTVISDYTALSTEFNSTSSLVDDTLVYANGEGGADLTVTAREPDGAIQWSLLRMFEDAPRINTLDTAVSGEFLIVGGAVSRPERGHGFVRYVPLP